MIQKVIILQDTQFDHRVYANSPAEDWLKKGIQVEFYHCYPFLNPETIPVITNHPALTIFNKEEDLIEKLTTLNPREVFIFSYFHFYDYLRYRIMRKIAGLGFRYCYFFSDDGDFPLDNGLLENRGIKNSILFSGINKGNVLIIPARLLLRLGFRLWIYIKSFFEKFVSFLKKPDFYVHKFLYRRLGICTYRGPDFWVVRDQGLLNHYFPHFFPFDHHSEILWTHAENYDDFIRLTDRSPKENGFVVYLDQYVPFLYEIGVDMNIKPEEFYPKVNGLLKFINNRYKLQLVMTTHPWGKKEKIEPWIDNCRLEMGKSIELIRDSNLVVAMCTTAINYAIAFFKPILFITTNKIEKTHFRPYIHGMAKFLGCSVLNLDELDLNKFNLNEVYSVNKEKYQKYIDHYILKPGVVEDKLSWEIVLEKLKTYD